MAGIVESIGNIISSIMGLFASIFQTILDIFASIFHAIISAIQSVFSVIGTLGRDLVDLMSGLVGFLLGNIVIIGVLIAAFVGYTVFQQRQGKSVTGKKTN
ncbi:hypothetical protein MMC13_006476 [Lambiella insularis]|nr:hypothetical protein [Lambiella insularis]